MRNLARRLIAAEHRADDPADTEGRAAFRVCERLRDALAVVVGTQGCRALLARALTLSAAEVPWLGKMKVSPTGALMLPAELECDLEPKSAAAGGVALVGQVLELLATFIGEALTRRLLRQIWPKVAFGESQSGGKK